MTELLQQAIDKLERLVEILAQNTTEYDGKAYARQVGIELHAYREVLEGKPRDEVRFHHTDDRYLYAQKRVEAEQLAGLCDQRETNP